MTEDHDNGWTLKTLERFLSGKIDSLALQVSTRVDTDRRALDNALESMDRRLEGMNEFRQTLQDARLAEERERLKLSENFIPRELFEAEHRALEVIVQKSIDRVAELDKKLFALSELKADKREGVSVRYMNGAIIFAGLSFLLSLLGGAWGLLHNH